MKTKEIIKQIMLERHRQNVLHGVSNKYNSHIEWALIMGEEKGEVDKAIIENIFSYENANPEDIKKEIIEVIAVGFAWLEHLF